MRAISRRFVVAALKAPALCAAASFRTVHFIELSAASYVPRTCAIRPSVAVYHSPAVPLSLALGRRVGKQLPDAPEDHAMAPRAAYGDRSGT
jgi:hypothetical protein